MQAPAPFEIDNTHTSQRFCFRWLPEGELHVEGVRRQQRDGLPFDGRMPFRIMNATVLSMEMCELIETFPPDQRPTLK